MTSSDVNANLYPIFLDTVQIDMSNSGGKPIVRKNDKMKNDGSRVQ